MAMSFQTTQFSISGPRSGRMTNLRLLENGRSADSGSASVMRRGHLFRRIPGSQQTGAQSFELSSPAVHGHAIQNDNFARQNGGSPADRLIAANFKLVTARPLGSRFESPAPVSAGRCVSLRIDRDFRSDDRRLDSHHRFATLGLSSDQINQNKNQTHRSCRAFKSPVGCQNRMSQHEENNAYQCFADRRKSDCDR